MNEHLQRSVHFFGIDMQPVLPINHPPYFIPELRPADEPVASTEDFVEYVRRHWEPDHMTGLEELRVVLLDYEGQPLGFLRLMTAKIRLCEYDMRLLFSYVLGATVPNMVVCQNSVTGSLLADPKRYDAARRIEQIAAALGSDVVDYVVVSSDGYESLSDNGVWQRSNCRHPVEHFDLF